MGRWGWLPCWGWNVGNKTWAGEWKEAVRGGVARWYPNVAGLSMVAAEVDDDGWRVWAPGASYYEPTESGPEIGRAGNDRADAALRRLGGIPDWTAEAPTEAGVYPVSILGSKSRVAEVRTHGDLWRAFRVGNAFPFNRDAVAHWLWWPVPLDLPAPPAVEP